MNTFAVLQLSGCAGCEVSLLDAEEWVGEHRLVYMPLVLSTSDVPPVDILLVSGGILTDEDLYNLQRAVRCAARVVAVGTCAISGGVPSLGDRDEVREMFIAQEGRRHVPRLLPRCSPIDTAVDVALYLPGCPPTPELFMGALTQPAEFEASTIVCQECGRKKLKDMRPAHLVGFQKGEMLANVCLINQGFLCIGSSTRGGCRAPCPRAGHPCVGCRGPSNILIEKESSAWFSSIQRVFGALTDVPPEEVDAGMRSPQYALFLFQFSDYAAPGRPPRPKEKVL
jgi:F420-non-reducing hydrogenase small subunit